VLFKSLPAWLLTITDTSSLSKNFGWISSFFLQSDNKNETKTQNTKYKAQKQLTKHIAM